MRKTGLTILLLFFMTEFALAGVSPSGGSPGELALKLQGAEEILLEDETFTRLALSYFFSPTQEAKMRVLNYLEGRVSSPDVRARKSGIEGIEDDETFTRLALAYFLFPEKRDSKQVFAYLEQSYGPLNRLNLTDLRARLENDQRRIIRDIEEMILIPEGEFLMGSDEEVYEKPIRKVSVETFFIDRYEVTNARYKEFTPSHTYSVGQDNHPIVNVTWFEAQAYCEWAGKRLPTEEEWEKASRGIDGRRYPWGARFESQKANTKESGIGGVKPVGSYPEGASPYEVMDMSGNVWEWTDSWDDNKTRVYRILRGGSWENDATYARSSKRITDIPGAKYHTYGFRCVVSFE